MDIREWPLSDAGSGITNDNDSTTVLMGLFPHWPAPDTVHAVSTLRGGGVSSGPYQGLNLGDHVGDTPDCVSENRLRLQRSLKLPSAPLWLSQVHGTTVIDAYRPDGAVASGRPQADATLTSEPGIVCAVLTADCLPLLFCDRQGTRVAAAHAGWRGLADGIIERTFEALGVPATELLVWMGPAIGAAVFEVGAEVHERFIRHDPTSQQAFRPVEQGRYLADITLLARQRLQGLGVDAVYGGQWCTYSQPQAFYSYRRDGVTGRMASLIWMS